MSTRTGVAVNVLDFGADPTGARDSTEAFQAAADAAAWVDIPAGTFAVSRIPDGAELRGAWGGPAPAVLRDGKAET